MLAENDFISLINKYTQIQGKSKSCIDNIFFSTQKIIINGCSTIVFDTYITDHKATITFFMEIYILNESRRKVIKSNNNRNFILEFINKDWTHYNYYYIINADQILYYTQTINNLPDINSFLIKQKSNIGNF